MEIRIFGPGCPKCAEVEKLVREMAAVKGGTITVHKVSDLKEMMAAGILSTPTVAVDGVVKAAGRVPSKEEVAAWLEGAAEAPASNASSVSSDGCRCGGTC